MPTRFRDLSGARVLLAGTGSHTAASGLPDVPAVAATLADLRRVLVDRCGLAPGAVRVLLDPPAASDLGRAVAEVTEQAEGLVVVYYVGHGLIAPDGALYLATTSTQMGRHVRHSAAHYQDVRHYLLESPALNRVVVLDCCFSGRVAGALGHDVLNGLADVSGSFVLTAAGREEVALAPPGEPHTAFSGRLIQLLDEGDPNGPYELSLRHVYEYLARVLPAAGYPRPRSAQDGDAHALVVAPNRGYQGRASRVVPDRPASVERVCPYMGLAAFDTADERWFHGRRRLTSILASRLADCHLAGRPLVVVGASGSGKSSLLFAGLLPAVRRGQLGVPGAPLWRQLVMKPGTEPVANLTQLLDSADVPTVLVIDQGEEIFTECSSPVERAAFVRLLDSTAAAGGAVVVALRSDFLGQWVELLDRGAVLEDKPVVVRSMSVAETQQAILGPASTAGLEVEPGLLETVLGDLGVSDQVGEAAEAEGAYEAGRLPLLSHALLMTWEQSEGQTLTTTAYQQSGGIRGALRSTADDLLAGFDEAGQQAARDLFLRLVHVGDGVDDTRRRVPRSRLLDEARDEERTAEVLTKFTGEQARLLTVDDDGLVEITHEALLAAWPTLRGWIDEDRAGLVVQQQLVQAAESWSHDRTDTSALLTGGRLAAARVWAADPRHRSQMPDLAESFLEASANRESRRARFRAIVTTGLVVLLVLSASAAVVALRQWRAAVAQQRIAVARGLQVQAESLRASDPRKSLQLGIAAHTIHPSADAALSLGTTLNDTRFAGSLPGLAVESLSPDGRTAAQLVGGDDGRAAVLWDIAQRTRPDRLATLTVPGEAMVSAEFSPDGRRLATGLHDHRATLWDIADPTHPHQLANLPGVEDEGDTGMIDRLAFAADGRTLAFANMNGVVMLWNIAAPTHPVRLATLPDSDRLADGGGTGMVFSRDGRTLFASRADGGILAWDLSRPTHPRVRTRLANTGTTVAMQISPNGRMLATAAADNSGTLWNITDPAHLSVLAVLTGHTKPIVSIAFGPDGLLLATGAADETAIVWDLSRPARPLQMRSLTGNDGPVWSLAFSIDGRALAAAAGQITFWTIRDTKAVKQLSLGQIGNQVLSDDGRLVAGLVHGLDTDTSATAMWDFRDPRRPARSSVTRTATVPTAISNSGALLATSGPTEVHLWDVTDPGKTQHLAAIPISSNQEIDGPTTTFRSDSRVLAVQAGGQLTLWDLRDPRNPAKLRTFGPARSGSQVATAFSPDGAWLAVDAGPTGIQLWPLARANDHPIVIPPIGEEIIRDIAFSPDGRRLAAGTEWGVIALWDVSSPEHPRALTRLTGTFSEAFSVTFSPDSETLAAGTDDGRAILWNIVVPSGPIQVAALAHDSGSDEAAAHVNGVGFGTDRNTFTTLSEGPDDTYATIWDITLPIAKFADPVAQACITVGQGLTTQEWAAYITGLPFTSTCPTYP